VVAAVAMAWYSTVLFFESIHVPPESGESIWEERTVLIEAVDDEEARKRAAEYGKTEEHSYPNSYGVMVNWKFDSIDRLTRLDASEFGHGLEISSRFLTQSEVVSQKRSFPE
jgi:hypothetical protein